MDTKEFLETLLPEEGVKFVARWFDIPNHPRKGIFMHKPFYDLDEMADNIKWHATKGNTVYHACSTYKEVKYLTTKTGKEVPAGRTKDNALAARALWLDFDVGKEAAHSYTSKKEAVDSLAEMIKALNLPVPMIVDSGNGVHAYFLLDESLPRSEWDELANLFRTTCDNFGLKYDPSRSSDIASILRPPGTFNLKNPDNPKPVVVKREGVRRPAGFYTSTFQAYLDEHGITVMPLKRQDFGGLNSDLITNIEYPDSHAAVIVQHCQQIRLFSENGGSSEPVWYACLGLLKHCVDGEVAAHEWGAKHKDYDEVETSAKMEQWDFGPPTCDKFRDINAEGCAGCERSCKSPIQLGHVMPENVEHTPLKVEDDETPQDDLKVGPGSEFWPQGYRVANGRIEVTRESEDGTFNYIPLASPPFWLLSEVRSETGEFMLHMRAEIKEGRFHDFDIPTASTSSADKLKSALAANRVYALSASAKAGFEMQNFVQQASLAMSRKREEINTFTQMGWGKDGKTFLLGKALISQSGIVKVRVGESISSVSSGDGSFDDPLQAKGSLEEYFAGVKYLYNRKGYEAYQYILSATIGAYVTELVQFSEWHGIPLLVYSKDSGYGKTTVTGIGLNAVCHNGLSRATDGTTNFFKSMLEVYGSMPIFLDESSKQFKPGELQEFLYSWPSGRRKGRLKQNGAMQSRGMTWNNMGITTSNQSMLHALVDNDVSPEATQVRVMEINLQECISEKPDASNDKKLAEHLLSNVYGLVGERLIRAIIKNADKLSEMIESEYHDISSKIPPKFSGTARFLCYHAACTLVGARLGKKLGLWDFSVAGMKDFIVAHIRRQMEKISQYKVTPEDRFGAMMADLHGKMLVTHRFDSMDGRRKGSVMEEPLIRIHGNVAGRYAIGCAGTKDCASDPGRLYVTISAINKWCSDHKLNSAELRKDWRDAGLVETNRGSDANGEKLVKLGRGVIGQALPPTRCVEFVVSKVRDAIPEVDSLSKADVVPLKKAGGE